MSIDERLLEYFATREQQRSEAVEATLAAMTPREARLVREAAVMGYVQGVRATPGGHRETIPPDDDVLHRVVDACLHFDDLYPVINSPDQRSLTLYMCGQPTEAQRWAS